MTQAAETKSMAVFCDFENVALGVRDANYEQFDINKVMERLLLKGNIVVKKAYCDWGRYKEFKATMHEASFELIEIPHVRQSGKNSADIRMVVDALDLCYTKSHVDTFVIISGDSDFSPLVSKLRENDKTVIGVGVKKSTSDLLIANCDEFIYYDDLVRPRPPRGRSRASEAAAKPATKPATGRAAKAADYGMFFSRDDSSCFFRAFYYQSFVERFNGMHVHDPGIYACVGEFFGGLKRGAHHYACGDYGEIFSLSHCNAFTDAEPVVGTVVYHRGR